jgi:hypothetical protein
MIDIKEITVMNFENAFHGMRNPMKSWDQSDSAFYCDDSLAHNRCAFHEGCAVELREKDLALAQKLILSGTDHSKFMRQIFVSMDINAPLYFFKELDTYKVGTVSNSTSTMHTIMSQHIYFARRNHKLTEWHNFCEMIEVLPYGKELICVKGEK